MSERRWVLALDGGGIRGIIPARVLQEIETLTGRRISDLFDLVSGTSTGGIIALGLVKPADGTPQYSAEALLDLYMHRGEDIFPRSPARKIATFFGLADVRYSAAPLEEMLIEHFGETPLSSALTEIVVPAYDLSAPAPYFFKRSYARELDHTWDVPMRTVARATSAAPTYFDPARLPELEHEGDHALVDGGTFANNPAVAAYADAVKLWRASAEINVLSIGTGRPPQAPGPDVRIPVSYERARHWGLIRWTRPILEVVLDGVAKAVEWDMEQLLKQPSDDSRHGARYHRLQSPLPTASHKMDDASWENRQALKSDAERLIRNGHAALDAICDELTA
jgi:patatin-like phospholipase/acyl hydrolase